MSHTPRTPTTLRWWMVTGLISALLVIATAVSAYRSRNLAELQMFRDRAERLANGFESATKSYEVALYCARGLFDASKYVDRDEWSAYLDDRTFHLRLRHADGFAYLQRIEPGSLDAFLKEVRANGVPGFEPFNGDGSPLDVTAQLTIVKYHTGRPDDLVGLIATASPEASDAMTRAAASGRMAVGTWYHAATEAGDSPKHAVYLPVYEKKRSLDTPDERLDGVSGWVACRIDIDSVLRSASIGERQDILLTLIDGEGRVTVSSSAGPDPSRFEHVMSVNIGDQTWTVVARQAEGAANLAGGSAATSAVLVALIGTLVTLLVWSQGRAGDRDRKLADDLTDSLRFQKRALDESAIVAVTDLAGNLLHVNDNYCEITGYDREELLGRSEELLDARHHEEGFFASMLETARLGGTWRAEVRIKARNGLTRWLDTTVVPSREDDGRVTKFVHIRHDITAQKQAESARRQSEERYALAVQGSGDGVWDWDLQTDTVYYSDRWKEMLGCADEGVSTSTDEWFGRILPSGRPRFHEHLNRHIEGGSSALDCEIEMRHGDGSARWMLCRAVAIRDESGNAVRLAGSLADIDELKRTQEKLEWMALNDPLTDLPNRRCFADHVARSLARVRRNADHRFAVLFFDFDKFKMVNDTLGHGVGDKLLCSIADRFRSHCRQTDIVARFGGDEFVVLLDDIEGVEEAKLIAEGFVDIFARPHGIEGLEVTSTASIGVVSSELGYEEAEEMLRHADAAVYQAKTEGRSQYRVFDSKLMADTIQRHELENDLRNADIDTQFGLAYQPIICLETGDTVGFEALVRWNHPEHGQISPDLFISIAEESAFIIQLGEWVLRQACRQLCDWQTRLPPERSLTMNVNVSKRQLTHPGLIDMLDEVVEGTLGDPAGLKIEITESTIMDDRHNHTAVLKRIRDRGIQLAMDDFGTGHSSLSCLHRFPLDVLKIDRSFIVNLEKHREFSAVLHAIITLAHHLKLEVVAEGIEKPEQVAQLQTMDCHYAQGYYFSPPLTPAMATDYLFGDRDLGRTG